MCCKTRKLYNKVKSFYQSQNFGGAMIPFLRPGCDTGDPQVQPTYIFIDFTQSASCPRITLLNLSNIVVNNKQTYVLLVMMFA